MGVSVYVMPLGTWLTGSFMTTWGQGRDSLMSAGPRKSEKEARQGVEGLKDELERLLAFRPDWDESGPARTATTFSIDGFAAPFLLARRWLYRLKLPLLASLEPPQIWIPEEFDSVLHFAAPWSPDTEVMVASAVRLKGELYRLQQEPPGDSEREELVETYQVARRLQAIASVGIEHRVPVIVEG